VCIFKGQENFSLPGDLILPGHQARILITKPTELLQLRMNRFKGLNEWRVTVWLTGLSHKVSFFGQALGRGGGGGGGGEKLF